MRLGAWATCGIALTFGAGCFGQDERTDGLDAGGFDGFSFEATLPDVAFPGADSNGDTQAPPGADASADSADDGSPSADGAIDTGAADAAGGDGGLTGASGWLSASCVYTDGTFCIGYTNPECADSDPYGGACSSASFPGGPVLGPRVCSQDPSSTTYRCLHQWCAYGCIPGGTTQPDYNWKPVFTCGNVASCGM